MSLQIIKAKEYKVKNGDTVKSLAENAGLTWQELAIFNWGTDKPRELNKQLNAKVGCRKKTNDGKNYVFSDEDYPGIVYIPEKPEKKSFSANKENVITVKRPKRYASINLQTCDIFGQKLGSISLILKSNDGWPDVNITTDADGFAKKEEVLIGSYNVLTDAGKPTYFLTFLFADFSYKPNLASTSGSLIEAVIHTDLATEAVSRIIILKGDAAEQKLTEERSRLLKRYNPPVVYAQPSTPDPAPEPGQEDEGKQEVSPSDLIYCTDNLAVSAGVVSTGTDKKLKIEVGKMIKDKMPSWIKDYFPEIHSRGYYVIVLDHSLMTLSFYSYNGELQRSFNLKKDLVFGGPVGAYAVFEKVDNSLFLDMASSSFKIQFPQGSDDVDYHNLVEESDKEDLIRTENKYEHKIPILYYLCSGSQLYRITIRGGTGRLEDYGSDENVQESVHIRNLDVVKAITELYNNEIRLYIRDIEKTANEKEIREIGPPLKYYQMPKPAGIDDDRWMEILLAMKTIELDAWKAIANRLDDFAGRRSQGCPFIRFNLKYGKEITTNKKSDLRPANAPIKVVVGAEVEYNFEVEFRDDGAQVLKQSRVRKKVSLVLENAGGKPEMGDTDWQMFKKTKASASVDHTVDLTRPERDSEWTISAKVEDYGIQFSSTGNTKFSAKIFPGISAIAEGSKQTAAFMGGVEIEGKGLADAIKANDPKWYDDPKKRAMVTFLTGFKIALELGYQGMREETMLIILSNAPGFFERRSIADLLSVGTSWNDLILHEQSCLITLGWSQELWDFKFESSYNDKLPRSITEEGYEYSPEEKVAIVHLGFVVYNEYKETFRKAIMAQYK